MWMKKTILIALILSLAGSMSSFADIVYQEDYESNTAGDNFPAWNWANGTTTHTALFADYEGSIVVEHTGVINNTGSSASNCRFGSKWDITLSGNTSSDPADYYIAFDILNVSGNWDPIDIEFFVLTKEGPDQGFGSGVAQYAQADGWIHVVANLADLTAGWWEGQGWVMTNSSWSIEVGGPPYPGTSVPAGQSWDQVWLMDNLIITMGEEPPSPATELATSPVPDDEATDVFYEPSLSWTPGEYADTHNVYLGTNFDDVNDADETSSLLVGPAQDANNYIITDRLEFGQTYFWRVDEVNAPPDNTVFKGDVWSFTVEPFVYEIPAANIIPTASNSSEGQGPEKTIDSSGLDENDLHSIISGDMWLSVPGDPGSAWIQYEFDKPYKLHEMLVWNYNGETILTLYGIKEVKVEYSTDAANWTQLGNVTEFAQATGAVGYASNITVPFEGAAAKYVRITANSNHGGGEGFFNKYGLSEVRFMYIPVNARYPVPDSGVTEIAIDTALGWRPGREAAEHKVYLSTDQQAVIDGTASVTTVNQASYSPDLALGSTYYWRVDEVNNVEIPTTWQGEVWNFATQEYLVVEDFESYNDIPEGQEGSNLVYITWEDGYLNPATNGSTMGYVSGASMETDIVYGGNQSVPFSYNNTSASLSEVTVDPGKLPIGRNWSIGSPTALMLWVYGDPGNTGNDRLYVKVGNSKFPYDGDITTPQWRPVIVDLMGVNLNNVSSLTIGIERSGGAGGSGIVFIDEIRLYGTVPAPKIAYVDATDGEAGNTTLATGEVFSPVDVGSGGSGADGLWRIRAFGQASTIYESRGDWAGNNTEDCPRLMTSFGVPEGNYDVYAYMWTADAATWRIAASLENSEGDLPLYLCNDPNGEATLAVAEDIEAPVPLLTEDNRTLWQVYIGTTGITTTITVYIDDDPNSDPADGGNSRVWYDGIGYKAVLPVE